MRILACSIIMATAILSAAAPARAQTYDPDYPVCMHVYGSLGGGDYFDCSYTSIPQCKASASGRSASCLVNPYFAPAYDERPARGHRRHRHAH